MKEQESGINSKFAPAVFPADIMYDENLDSTERWILTILFTYTNAHTNTAFPSYQTIADRSGFSRRTCIRTVDSLTGKGYIVKKEVYQKTKDGKINQSSNLYTLCFKIRGSDTVSLGNNGGSDTVSLGVVTLCHPNYPIELSIEEEEEEQTKNIPKKYIAMALKVGASKADLEAALKKMDCEPDIKNHVAWLRKALESEVINRELGSRPKTKRDPKPSAKPPAAKQPKRNSNKYDDFYL